MRKRIKSYPAVRVVSSFGIKLYFQLRNYETENITMFVVKKIPIMYLEWGAINCPIFQKIEGLGT